MNKSAAWVAMIGLTLGAAGACKKKDKDAPATEPAATEPAAPSTTGAAEPPPAPAPATDPNAAADEARRAAEAKAEKQALLEYATLEDKYLSDAKGQWASAAKASSSFGDAGQKPPESQDGNTPWNATGAPNGKSWTNGHQDMGIDWLQVTFATPVHATELRMVQTDGMGSVSKLELIDEAGAPHEIWSGADETKRDERGPRTWMVRTFEKTAYKVAGAKISFANAVVTGYKAVDAVQLVGE